MEKKNHKLRIMFSSNAIWSPSGYANQVKDLLPRIKGEGYPLAIVNFFGQTGGIFELDGIKQYPMIVDPWGSDAVLNHQQDFNADIVFTLQDIWVLQADALRGMRRWTPIVPIDHEPAPQPIVDRLKLANRIVTYSKFGYDELKRCGLHSTYIQHTVDTKIFKPMSDEEKAKVREGLGIPQDYFIFGMVAANKETPPRKSFQEVMDAFKLFHDRHPKSALYFHVQVAQGGGFSIVEYAKFLGIEKFIYHTPPYPLLFTMDKAEMSKLMNSFDCLLMPSTNEGFGLPAIEAQASGTPAIVNNFTSMPELVKKGITGEICKVASKRWTPLFSYIGVPDTQDLYKCMERIFSGDRKKMSEEARRFMVEEYDTDKVFREKWIPFLSRAEREVYGDETLLTEDKVETKIEEAK